jgi:hypothetical protein
MTLVPVGFRILGVAYYHRPPGLFDAMELGET